MRRFAFSVAGSGRFVPDKPTVSYVSLGTFNISNYDSGYIYTLSNGTLNNGVVTLASANQSCTITARSPKGISNSTQSGCERKSRDQYFVVTQAAHCDCCPGTCGGCCGPGTFHSCVCDQGGGCQPRYLACCTCGYYNYYDYSGSGYTLNTPQTEWYKIS